MRDEVRAQQIAAAGLIVLPDGQPGEPEVALSLSAPRGARDRRSDGTGPPPAFDTLITSIGTALAFDPTLGGLCDWAEPEAPASVGLPNDGAALKAAAITVVVHYTTADPLA